MWVAGRPRSLPCHVIISTICDAIPVLPPAKRLRVFERTSRRGHGKIAFHPYRPGGRPAEPTAAIPVRQAGLNSGHAACHGPKQATSAAVCWDSPVATRARAAARRSLRSSVWAAEVGERRRTRRRESHRSMPVLGGPSPRQEDPPRRRAGAERAHIGAAQKLASGDRWRFTRRGGLGHVDRAYAVAGSSMSPRPPGTAASPGPVHHLLRPYLPHIGRLNKVPRYATGICPAA